MFDVQAAYMTAFMDRDNFIRSGEKNEGILQAYTSLINVLSNDIRFRALNYIAATHNED